MFHWDDSLSAALLRWIAILPLLAAVLHGLAIGLLRARISDPTIWLVSFSALFASFGMAVVSLFDLVTAGALEPQLDAVAPWIGGGVGARSFSSELTFQYDPISAVFSICVTGVTLVVYLCTIGRVQYGIVGHEDGHRIFALLDLLVGSTLVLILADNLLLFFLGWTGVGIASQLFASFAFEDREASRAGATTFVLGRIGDLGLLGAMLLLFDGLSRAGAPSLTFRGIEAAFRLLEGQDVGWLAWGTGEAPLLLEIVGLGLVLSALTKCAQLPLHFWLPAAAAGPIAANALMQSVTTVVAGVYVLLRFAFLLEHTLDAQTVLVVAGATTMVLASLAAATQLDLPKLIAYTTSSLFGLVMIGIGIGAYSAACFLVLTHAVVKCHLILVMGHLVSAVQGETDLRRMGGLAHRMRWTQAMFALGGLALVGFAPLANFFPIEELLAFLTRSERPGAAALVLATCASMGLLAFALARAYFLIFWGNVRPGGRVDADLQDPRGLVQQSLTFLALLLFMVGPLSPSQFWAELFGAPTSEADSIGHFLAPFLPGTPDPGIEGLTRWRSILGLLACIVLGLGVASARYATRGYRGEPKRAASRLAITSLREMLFLERAYTIALVRPIRRLSRVALEGAIENRLIDRVVVSGGSGLVRRFVWTIVRRLQNGLLQSYALLALLAMLVVVSWMVA